MGKITQHNINQYKQNRISLIVKDLEYYVPEEIVRKVMLKRGINKWLYCRKKFIELKNDLKFEVTQILKEMKFVKALKKDISLELGRSMDDDHKIELRRRLYKLCKQYDKLVGQLKATSEIKEQIRKICHLSRWQFPE